MARTRLLKPEFFRSEDVATLPPMARLLFAGLWTIADKDGRLLDRPRRIAVDIFPYDDDPKVDDLLAALAERRVITRYEANGVRCIQINGFAKHQTPHYKEPSLGLQPPPETHTNTQSPGFPRLVEESRVKPPLSGSDPDPVSGLDPEIPPTARTRDPVATEPDEGDAPPALTGPYLAQMFGRMRTEVIGGLEWQGAATSAEGAANKAAAIAATPGAAQCLARSMRRFWESVRDGSHEKATEVSRKPSFAFGCWFSGFHGDVEQMSGQSPTIAPPAVTARGSPRKGWLEETNDRAIAESMKPR